jgi:hypothetical protein
LFQLQIPPVLLEWVIDWFRAVRIGRIQHPQRVAAQIGRIKQWGVVGEQPLRGVDRKTLPPADLLRGIKLIRPPASNSPIILVRACWVSSRTTSSRDRSVPSLELSPSRIPIFYSNMCSNKSSAATARPAYMWTWSA